ncbi:hypothetical protein PT974_05857 [Cladobotryum mycophilum]|uniref:Tubby C-terminal-like domain-containing protein n=1 Tax=Cladobotryum mycophilum TaxID=491253 RepID=A0ABR0SJZ1_9HYPO
MSSPETEPAPSSRIFQVNRTSYTKHYDITTSSGEPLYYAAQSSGISSKTPDLVLRRGNSNRCPVVAVSYMFRLASGFKIGFGDPDAEESITWEDLTMQTRNASEHRLHLGQNDQRSEFVWKRTHSAKVLGEKPRALSMRNYKLLDAETNQVLATFRSTPSFKKCGVLQIHLDRGDDFDVMVFITCLSIYEKSRRRQHGAPIGKDDS